LASVGFGKAEFVTGAIIAGCAHRLAGGRMNA
jgi:hypothetical protein